MRGGLRSSSYFLAKIALTLIERRMFYDSIYNPVDHISGGGFGNDCCLRSKRHCSDSAVRRCDCICIDCGLDH